MKAKTTTLVSATRAQPGQRRTALIVATGKASVDVLLDGGTQRLNSVAVIGAMPAIGAKVEVELRQGRYVALGTGASGAAGASGGLVFAGGGGGATAFAQLTGTIADAQAPQFLKADGSRPLTGNMAVSAGVTFDGYDVSALGDLLSGATHRAEGTNSLLRARGGFQSLGQLRVGNADTTLPTLAGNWFNASDIVIETNDVGVLAFSNPRGASFIGGSDQRIVLGYDAGFGQPVIEFPGKSAVFPDGYIGAGTDAPAAPLHAAANASPAMRLENSVSRRYLDVSVGVDGLALFAPSHGRMKVAGTLMGDYLRHDTVEARRLRAVTMLSDRFAAFSDLAYFTERAAPLATTMTMPSGPLAGQRVRCIVEEPMDSTARVFTEGALVEVIGSKWEEGKTTPTRVTLWGRISDYTRDGTTTPALQTYFITIDGTKPGTAYSGYVFPEGSPVLQFGTTGGQYMVMAAGGTSSPAMQMSVWTEHPEADSTLTPISVMSNHVEIDTPMTTWQLRVPSLIVDRQTGINGELIAAQKSAYVTSDFVMPAAGGSVSVVFIEPADNGSANLFTDNAIVGMSMIAWTGPITQSVTKAWGTVVFVSRDTSVDPPRQTYTFTRSSGGNAGNMATDTVVPSGTLAVQYGISSGQYLTLSPNISGVPLLRAVSWTTHPAAAGAKEAQLFGDTTSGVMTISSPSNLLMTLMRDTGIGVNKVEFRAQEVNSIGIGLSALQNATASAIGSVVVGANAGASITSAANNTIIGAGAGGSLNGSSHSYNTFVGYLAGQSAVGGSNVYIGHSAAGNATSSFNVAIGRSAFANPTNSSSQLNTVLGYSAASSGGIGARNVIVGAWTAFGGLGDENVIVGYSSAYYSSTGTGNVFVGAYAGQYEGNSNRLYIANSYTSTPLLYGEFDNAVLRVHGKLQARGTATPQFSVQYDATKYADFAVSSGGVLTITPSSASLVLASDLTLSGARKIAGDFSSALASRTLFRTSVLDGQTWITAMPNGIGLTSGATFLNADSTANSSTFSLYMGGAAAFIVSGKIGSGTYYPIVFYVSGVEAARLTAAGAWLVGTSSPTNDALGVIEANTEIRAPNLYATALSTNAVTKIGTSGLLTPSLITDDGTNITVTGTGKFLTADWSNGTIASRLSLRSSTTDGNTIIPIVPNGTATQAGIRTHNTSHATNYSVFNFYVDATAGRIRSTLSGTGTTLPIYLETGGANARLAVTPSGAVLVGKTTATVDSPGVLEIQGTAATQFSTQYDASNRLDVSVSSAGNATLTPTGSLLTLNKQVVLAPTADAWISDTDSTGGTFYSLGLTSDQSSTSTTAAIYRSNYYGLSVNPASNPSSTQTNIGLYSDAFVPASNSQTLSNVQVRAITGFALYAGTGTLSTLGGMQGTGRNLSTGTVTTGFAVSGNITNNDVSGVFTAASAIRGAGVSNTGTITTYSVFRAENQANTGTIGTAYGYYAGTFTGGTWTNQPYSFYAASTSAYNSFAGPTAIGDSAALPIPGAALRVNGAASAITAIFRAHATTPGNLTEWQDSSSTILASISSGGNLVFGGTSKRITGDLDNATIASRLMFQHSGSDKNSTLGIMPSGTATTSAFLAVNGSDPANAGRMNVNITSSDAGINILSSGSGALVPLRMKMNSTTRIEIDTSGNIGFFAATPVAQPNATTDLGTVLSNLGLRASGTGYGVSTSAAIVSTNATAGVGYATGAGGTVTQSTSKSTGVTLNKVCGQITMNNAALAAATTVTFTLTNSAIAATDVLILNHVSAGTAGAYTLNAQCASGSASINVRNVSGGSLSEAIVLAFVVVKGVTS